jgi:hypothetical protein
MNCANGSPCRILPAQALVPTTNGASNYGQAVMALDSAQHSLEVYHSRMDAGTVWIEHPTDEPTCPPTAGALSRTLICIPAGLGNDGDRTTHEMGHVLQMQQFNEDGLRNALTGGTWSISSQEYESGATTEGFATYAAVVAWWDPANGSSSPVYSTMNIEANTPTVTCVAPCACPTENRVIPGQVAKAFWDLVDAANEGASAPATGADVTNLNSLTILSGRGAFPSGTANRARLEWDDPADPDDAGPDGVTDTTAVNLNDYDANFNVSNSTLYSHNCTVHTSL